MSYFNGNGRGGGGSSGDYSQSPGNLPGQPPRAPHPQHIPPRPQLGQPGGVPPQMTPPPMMLMMMNAMKSNPNVDNDWIEYCVRG